MKNTENFNYNNIKCDSKLYYDSKMDTFTLIILYYKKLSSNRPSK